MVDLDHFLKTKLGFESFRPGQKEVIQDVLSGRDVFARLPTGSGKTLCYLISGWLKGGLTLIVSPLLSLMEDQVRQMKWFGEKQVAALNSFLSPVEKRRVLNNLSSIRFLFASPEMLQISGMVDALRLNGVSLLVVDEAHCISQWGHDFRPDYLRLSNLKRTLGNPPSLALTATADKRVIEDITRHLELSDCAYHLYSVDRPNIAFKVEQITSTVEKYDRLVQLVQSLEGPGLVYFSSREATELASDLVRRKTDGQIRTAFYHAGMSGEDRLFIQNQFLNDQLDLVCSTNAFGMGLNKSNIRYVIHFHYPQTMNAYVQEVGRAGRDGGKSVAITLLAPEDHQLPEAMIDRDFPKEFEMERLFKETKQSGWTAQALYKAVINSGGSETAARFTSEQYEGLDPDSFERSKAILMKEVEKRKREKRSNLGSMRQWLMLTTCRREALLKMYDETLKQKPTTCCDHCGLKLEEYEQKDELMRQKIRPEIIEPWEKRLSELLYNPSIIKA